MADIHIDPTVQVLRELHRDVIALPYATTSIRDRLARQATTIHGAHAAGDRAVAFHLGSWCPDLVGADPARIMASHVTLDQMRETIAREHGYARWQDVEALQNQSLDEPFERAVDAVLRGDLKQLTALLQTRPALATERSRYGHRATLLHYLGANGIESYRQVTPLNAPDIARCLLKAGSDVNAPAGMYGGSTTTLELVSTSKHPHEAGVAEALVTVLREAGAD